MKRFKLGFTVGRFQFFHEGHKSLVDWGLEECDKFVVLIGSCDKSRTKDNPFTFEERKEMIETIYGDKVIVLPIFDLGIGYCPQWGEYLINTIRFNVGKTPDFYIGGVEKNRENWLLDSHITRLLISRSVTPVSATSVRISLAREHLQEMEFMREQGRPFAFDNGFYSKEQLEKWQEILLISGTLNF